jgi:hypothetical protein
MVGDGENLKLIASAASKQVTTYNNNTALNTLHNALLQQLECNMRYAFNFQQRLLPRHSSACCHVIAAAAIAHSSTAVGMCVVVATSSSSSVMRCWAYASTGYHCLQHSLQRPL